MAKKLQIPEAGTKKGSTPKPNTCAGLHGSVKGKADRNLGHNQKATGSDHIEAAGNVSKSALLALRKSRRLICSCRKAQPKMTAPIAMTVRITDPITKSAMHRSENVRVTKLKIINAIRTPGSPV